MKHYTVIYTLDNGRQHVFCIDAMNEKSACKFALSCCKEARFDIDLYGSVQEEIREEA